MIALARVAVVAVPVALLLAVEGRLGSADGAVAGVVIAGVFMASLHLARGATRSELLALRGFVAAGYGSVVAFLGIAAIDLPGWLDVSVLGLLGLTAAIFALAAYFESQVQRSTIRRLLIIGTGACVRDLIEETRVAPESFVVVGIVDDANTGSCAGVPILGRLEDLPAVLDAEVPDIVVVAAGRNRPTIFRHLLDNASLGFRVVELAQFYEHAFGRVPVRELTRAWFMGVLHLYRRPYSLAANRGFDIAVALLGLVLALPLLLVLPVLILTTRGPIILRQTRLGEHGAPFTMYKFRTMRANAEDPGLAVWAVEDDPRATITGRLMRRFRLDEIPQLWNVLKGEMSIVGPRPERPEFLARLQEEVPFWDRRHLIKPGITGWAQIRRGYTADTIGSTEKLSFDLWYLRHRSLLVDFAICVQTIGVLIRGGAPLERGAQSREDLRLSPYASLVGRIWSARATSTGTAVASSNGALAEHDHKERGAPIGSLRAEASESSAAP